jgi:transcriptional regulator with XRE-family HTH domain
MSSAEVLNNFFECDAHVSKRKRVYGRRQVVYSPKVNIRRKLTYMGRAPKTLFAITRGKKIRALRDSLQYSQAKFAEMIGVESREAVSQYESGTIKEISLPVVRQLIKAGLSAADLLEDPGLMEVSDQPLTMSAAARRVAYAWDDMPPMLRDYILTQLEWWTDLKSKSQTLAMLLRGPYDEEREKALYSIIESHDLKFRADNPIKKSKKPERSKE